MKKSTKIWLIIGIVIMVLGIGIAVIGFSLGASTVIHFRNGKLTLPSYGKVTESIVVEDFSNAVIDLSYFDVDFIKSDENKVEHIYYSEALAPTLKVENGVLHYYNNTYSDNVFAFDFGFNIRANNDENKVKIYYKSDLDLNKIKISSDFGKVNITELTAKEMELDADYAEMHLNNITTGKMDIEADFSDIKLVDAKVLELDYNSNYGEFNMNDVTADIMSLESEFGDVSGKGVIVSTQSELSFTYGGCDLQGDLLGRTKFDSEFADIDLNLISKDYGYEITSEFGDINVNGKNLSGVVSSLDGAKSSNMIVGKISFADVELNY